MKNKKKNLLELMQNESLKLSQEAREALLKDARESRKRNSRQKESILATADPELIKRILKNR